MLSGPVPRLRDEGAAELGGTSASVMLYVEDVDAASSRP